MLSPGTGVAVKEMKIKTNKGEEMRKCFSGTIFTFPQIFTNRRKLGKAGVDWILTVMPRLKNRSDCMLIAQQLVDRQYIVPVKPQKHKPPKFLDDDSILYYFSVRSTILPGLLFMLL